MEKARQLSESGQRVAYLLCYDTFDPIRRQHFEMKKEDSFLFQTLQERFRDTNIQLRFVSVRKVMQEVNQLISTEVNVFVDEFSFEYKRFDLKIRKEIMKSTAMLKLPKVR